MKNHLLLLICLFTIHTLKAQETPVLNENTGKAFVQHFTINNDQLQGEGAETLKKYIAASQFFVFGEYHGSAQLTTLCRVLLPELKAQGYENFAVEVGPQAAKKLKELSDKPSDSQKNLYDFNTKYYIEEDEDIPIPFFNTVEDAQLLTKSQELGFDLWGLDQEYFSGMFFLYDELLALSSQDASVQQLKTLSDTITWKLYMRDINESRFPFFQNLLENDTINNFFEKAIIINPDCAPIVEDLKISWDIYKRHQQRSLSSHLTRINYMRSNLLKHLEKENPDTKVFIKMGGLHTGKGRQLNAYDVGHLTEELARKNGTISTNITCDNRYYEEDGEIKDYWTDRWDKTIPFNFPIFGQKDQWTIIDLKAMKKAIEAGQLALPKDYTFHLIKTKLDNYDLMLLPPVDKDASPNYKLP